LSGDVNPNGTATSWKFEFGTSTNYGATTVTSSAGDGTTGAGVSSGITGLAPGTTYHYRLVAWSTAGTSYGSDGAFTTGVAPPGVTTDSASGVSTSAATLTGYVDPNGAATSWEFEFGTTTNYGSKTSTVNAGSAPSGAGVSSGISALASGTTYHFRLVAANAGGTVYGADKSFTTAGSPPTAVTGPASSLTPTTAIVAGNVDPNAVATSWLFVYGTSTNYGGKTATSNAGAGSASVSVSSQLSGLIPGTTYHYRVDAMSSAGTVYGADHAFTTPKTAPSVATKSTSGVGNTDATLIGAVNPNGLSTAWYFKYWDASGVWSTPAHSAGSGITPVNVSLGIAGLAPDTEYHFVLVSSSAGGSATGAELTFVTTGPPGATTGSATQIGAYSALLNGAIDPGGRTTTWFFEYGTSANYGATTAKHTLGGSGSSIPVDAGIGGLAPGMTYHFRLISENAAGKVYGADGSFTTPSPTISAIRPAITAGRAEMLSGEVPDGSANSTVEIFAEPLGSGSCVQVATVLTNAGGTWSLKATPTIETSYKVLWDGASSTILTLRVRPSVSLRLLPGGRVLTRVREQLPVAGHLVRLQRLVNGVWRTVATNRLNRASSALFRPHLPAGASRLRVLLTAFQAGNGYLLGVSAVHVYRGA
jgi:hypothetical protein